MLQRMNTYRCNADGVIYRAGIVVLAAFIIMIVLAIVAVMIWAIVTTSNSSSDQKCTIVPVGIRLIYEYGNATNAYQFVVDFNITTMQANYIFYLLANVSNANVVITEDTYRIDRLTPADYSQTAYNMMLLAMFANTPGNVLAVMNNVVPAFPPIISAWNNIIHLLAGKYSGKLIFTGCEYNIDSYVMSSLGNRIYLPVGFFYIVFDSNSLPAITSGFSGAILDYSYYAVGNFKLTNVPTRIYWASCD